MTLLRKVGENMKYSFSDAGCLGRECFAPGMYQHRSPMSGGGSRNTGSPDTPCCLNRAYRGCPSGPVGRQVIACDCEGQPHKEHIVRGLPVVDSRLKSVRKREGWKAL